jgi:hypothetical protein
VNLWGALSLVASTAGVATAWCVREWRRSRDGLDGALQFHVPKCQPREVSVATPVRARFRRTEAKYVLLTPIDVIFDGGTVGVIEPGAVDLIWLRKPARVDNLEFEVDLEAGRRLLIDSKPPGAPYRNVPTVSPSILIDRERASAGYERYRVVVVRAAALSMGVFIVVVALTFGRMIMTLTRGEDVTARIVDAEVRRNGRSSHGVLIVEADEGDLHGVHYDVELEGLAVSSWRRQRGASLPARVYDGEIVIGAPPQTDIYRLLLAMMFGGGALYMGAFQAVRSRALGSFFWAARSRNPWLDACDRSA